MLLRVSVRSALFPLLTIREYGHAAQSWPAMFPTAQPAALRDVPCATCRLIRTDGVIDALEKKTTQMEHMHTVREEDWHKLANTWVQYEKDLHSQYKK